MQIDLRLKTLHDPKSLLYKTVGHKKRNIKKRSLFSASKRQKVRTLTVKSTKYFWLFSPTQLLTLIRVEMEKHMRIYGIQIFLDGYLPWTMMIHFTNASLTHRTMMRAFWFNTTTFRAFEKYLAFFESKLLDNLFSGITLWNCSLQYALTILHQTISRIENIEWMQRKLTGSENMVRMCDAYARNANKLKTIIFTVL